MRVWLDCTESGVSWNPPDAAPKPGSVEWGERHGIPAGLEVVEWAARLAILRLGWNVGKIQQDGVPAEIGDRFVDHDPFVRQRVGPFIGSRQAVRRALAVARKKAKREAECAMSQDTRVSQAGRHVQRTNATVKVVERVLNERGKVLVVVRDEARGATLRTDYLERAFAKEWAGVCGQYIETVSLDVKIPFCHAGQYRSHRILVDHSCLIEDLGDDVHIRKLEPIFDPRVCNILNVLGLEGMPVSDICPWADVK